MRFSLTTIWLDFKIRAGLAMLLLGVGVYFGMAHQVLVEAYWPGTYILGGMIFFLGLFFSLGIRSVVLFERPQPLLQPFFDDHEWLPAMITKTVIILNAVAVLFATLLGCVFTDWAAGLWDKIAERFLVQRETWKIIAFASTMLPAGMAGFILGFIPSLSYLLILHINQAAFLQSDHRKIQRLVHNLINLVTLSVVTGWSLGYFLSAQAEERWMGVILIPAILSLLVVLLSLIGKTDASTISHEPAFSPGLSRRSAPPELANKKSKLTEYTAVLLGWLGVWQIVHWRYAMDNWCDLGRMLGDYYSGQSIIFLAGFAAALGIGLGQRLFPNRLNKFLTPIDRQGLALAALGLWTIITAVLMKSSFKADYLQTGLPQIVMPLSLIGIAAMWGVNVSLTISAMTLGRPDNMELWTYTLRRIGWGVALAGPTYLLWEYQDIGNLLAIAFGSLLAIAMGGVDLIYDEPGIGDTMRSTRTGRLIHAGCIVFLYLSLFFFIVFVPPLKAGWLKTVNHQRTTIREGLAGVASLIEGNEPELVWSGRFELPERTNPAIRHSIQEIINRIVTQRQNELSDDLRPLLINLPYQSAHWSAHAMQLDIDAAIREVEFKFLELPSPPQIRDISELYARQKDFNLSIAMLPPWHCRCTPDRSDLIKRILKHSNDLNSVWILLPAQNPDQQTKQEVQSLVNLIKNLTGKFPESTTIAGPDDYRWEIFSSPHSIETFIREKPSATTR
jgi:hypothetical protein